MLNGIDISHHNKNMLDPMNALNGFDFVIMKATEGLRFRDPMMKNYLSILQPETCKGFYHFCRPDLGNTPEDEATNFLQMVWPYLDGYSLLALDVEAGALQAPNLDGWLSVFAQIVEIETGIKPLIYCSAAEVKRFSACRDLSCGLWVAKWGKKPTKKQIEPWNFWAIWQYTSDAIVSGVRCDLDYFNGTKEQYLRYCECKTRT